MTHKRFVLIFCLPLLILFLVIVPTNGTSAQTRWVPDYWPTTAWQTSTPEAQGMDPNYLTSLDEYINDVDWGIAMVASLVIKNGYIVHETYYGTYGETHRRNIFSCTKSFVSTLVGIALSEGYISSVNENIVDFFSNRIIANMDSRKEALTIEHLLAMTAGFDWPEHPYGADSPYNQMTSSDDWVQFVLDRPMAHEPGEVWNYNSGASHLLSTIVNISTGQYAHEYAEDRLFASLGITHYDWGKDPDDNAFGGANLRLAPRDMAKLGFLFLNNGTWDGVQIVPADWVATATSSFEMVGVDRGYGYQWWTHPTLSAYSARGYLGQFIYVFPDLDMVVVFTASTNYVQDDILIEDFVLPAAGVRIGGAIPLNGELIPVVILGTIAIIISVAATSAYLLYHRKQMPSSSS